MLLLRLPGVLLFRFAARRFLALLFQLPPRFTRLAPHHPEPSRRAAGAPSLDDPLFFADS